MRRRSLLNLSENESSIDIAPMSVVFERKTPPYDLLIVADQSDWSTNAPSSTWKPIGIVVIPSNHGVLKDGTNTINQCGVMSLVSMSYSTPETGYPVNNGYKSMYFGSMSEDISNKSDYLNRYDSYYGNGLNNYNYIVCTKDSVSNVDYSLVLRAYLPIQKSVNGAAVREQSNYAPSPYIGNDYNSGDYNSSYGTTLRDSWQKLNRLADFRGIVNTKILTDLATAQSDWRTANTITNSYLSGYYPAACCCARYHTNGTRAFKDCATDTLKQGAGFWYMPACGELGYISVRLADIMSIGSNLNTVYGVPFRYLNLYSYGFDSSTEFYSLSSVSLTPFTGLIDGHNKNNEEVTNAFLRLQPLVPMKLRFVDNQGVAIPNMNVIITDAHNSYNWTTDANGYVLQNVAIGTVHIASSDGALSITSIEVTASIDTTIIVSDPYVDLGLPSGTLWARGNIVKDANGNYAIGNETDWGTYISWGNIIGHNEGEGYNFDQTTYNSTPGASVSANIPSNDAAHDFALATLGAPWNLPTKLQMKELCDNTDTEWVADYNGSGVAGRKFMKKTNHSVYVFFPASGYYSNTSLSSRGSYGVYYSSSFYSTASVYSLFFSSSSKGSQVNYNRYNGRSVRPVQTPVTLTLDPSSKTVTASSGSYTFTVYANSSILKDPNVTVSSNESWATPYYNSSTGKVTVSYRANTDTTSSRTAIITVSYNSSTSNHTVTLNSDRVISVTYTYDYSTAVFDVNNSAYTSSVYLGRNPINQRNLDGNFMLNATIPVTLSKRSKRDYYMSGNTVVTNQSGIFNGTASISNYPISINNLIRDYENSSGGNGSISQNRTTVTYSSTLGGATLSNALLMLEVAATVSLLSISGFDYTAHIVYTISAMNTNDSSWTTVSTVEKNISGDFSGDD